jgi:hypothetical protein
MTTFAFIAIDDDGAATAELHTLLFDSDTFGNQLDESGLAGGNFDSSGALTCTYTADDAADDANDAAGGADTLIKMQLTCSDDLQWSFVKIVLSVGDNVYTCSVAAGDDCTITQAGSDSNDNAWEPGEYIFLSEGSEEICSAQGCHVDISVTYNGVTVAGDGAVVVN